MAVKSPTAACVHAAACMQLCVQCHQFILVHRTVSAIVCIAASHAARACRCSCYHRAALASSFTPNVCTVHCPRLNELSLPQRFGPGSAQWHRTLASGSAEQWRHKTVGSIETAARPHARATALAMTRALGHGAAGPAAGLAGSGTAMTRTCMSAPSSSS